MVYPLLLGSMAFAMLGTLYFRIYTNQCLIAQSSTRHCTYGRYLCVKYEAHSDMVTLFDLWLTQFWTFWIIFGIVQLRNLHSHIWCYCCYGLSHVWRQDSIANNFESSKRFICFKSCTMDHGTCCLFFLPYSVLRFICVPSFVTLITPFLCFQVIIPFTKYPWMFSHQTSEIRSF